jgi:hypothetical protein
MTHAPPNTADSSSNPHPRGHDSSFHLSFPFSQSRAKQRPPPPPSLELADLKAYSHGIKQFNDPQSDPLRRYARIHGNIALSTTRSRRSSTGRGRTEYLPHTQKICTVPDDGGGEPPGCQLRWRGHLGCPTVSLPDPANSPVSSLL